MNKGNFKNICVATTLYLITVKEIDLSWYISSMISIYETPGHECRRGNTNPMLYVTPEGRADYRFRPKRIIIKHFTVPEMDEITWKV